MTVHIHIEGMGLLGSLLARRIGDDHTITWNDIDAPHTAWPVSTGLAYPDGSADNQLGLMRWYEELDDFPEAVKVPYVFAHKGPPHGGSYPVIDHGPLRIALPNAVAVNVPELVRNTRERFSGGRITGANPVHEPDVRVIAHTTPHRGDGYLWGWVARVRFEVPKLLGLPAGVQPALYAKAHRFDLTYAYPIPGTGQWWAGSVLRHQQRPKEAGQPQLYDLYERWEENAERLLQLDDVELVSLGQGWRPRAKADDSGRPERRGDTIVLPPMPTDGLRRGHVIVDQVLELL
jgi:hypothetical protein